MADQAAPAASQGPRFGRWGLTAYAIAAAVIVLDQLVKFWVLNLVQLQERGPVPVLPIFQLTMVWNPGVSFGLLRADTPAGRWILVGFATAVVAGLAWWARRIARPLTAVALGLVMGGAIGNNLIDRVRFGAVADFLDFHGLYFPWVFNVADSAICVGVGLLLLDSFVQREPKAG
jgi:signal peptidase II